MHKKSFSSYQCRLMTPSDIGAVVFLEQQVWGDQAATKENLINRMQTYAKGSWLLMRNDEVIGYAAVVRTSKKILEQCATWAEYTDNGNACSVYDATGDYLFGISLTVKAHQQLLGAGQHLAARLAQFAVDEGCCQIILGARMPHYHKHVSLAASDYVRAMRASRRLVDPELRFYTRLGLQMIAVRKNYFPDAASHDYGVMMAWRNPYPLLFLMRQLLVCRVHLYKRAHGLLAVAKLVWQQSRVLLSRCRIELGS